MDEIFDSIIDMYPDAMKRINVLITMYGYSGYDASLKKLTRTVDDQSATYLRLYILAYISYAVPYVDFESSSQAINLIGSLRPLFEAELTDTTINRETFSWISRIYSKCIADISTRGSQLPDVRTFLNEMLPIPVVAQYLYTDGSRADEIVIRNNRSIRHPLFHTGSLEVLSV